MHKGQHQSVNFERQETRELSFQLPQPTARGSFQPAAQTWVTRTVFKSKRRIVVCQGNQSARNLQGGVLKRGDSTEEAPATPQDPCESLAEFCLCICGVKTHEAGNKNHPETVGQTLLGAPKRLGMWKIPQNGRPNTIGIRKSVQKGHSSAIGVGLL